MLLDEALLGKPAPEQAGVVAGGLSAEQERPAGIRLLPREPRRAQRPRTSERGGVQAKERAAKVARGRDPRVRAGRTGGRARAIEPGIRRRGHSEPSESGGHGAEPEAADDPVGSEIRRPLGDLRRVVDQRRALGTWVSSRAPPQERRASPSRQRESARRHRRRLSAPFGDRAPTRRRCRRSGPPPSPDAGRARGPAERAAQLGDPEAGTEQRSAARAPA